MPQEKLSRVKPRAVLLAFAATFLIGVWAFAIHRVSIDEQTALDGAAKDARNLARAFQEHTQRTIQSVDQSALFLKYQYERLGNAFSIAQYVDTGIIIGDIFNLLSIIDDKGNVAMSNKPFTKMNLSDREHVRVHMQSDTGALYVSKPVLGRVSGKWSIQMTRRVNHADGSFGGVIVVSVDPFYFSNFYKGVDLGAGSSVTLIGRDGVVRARQAGDDASVGQDLSKSEMFQQMLIEGYAAGTFRDRSAVDGVERIYATRPLAGYPFFVTVGISIDEALLPYFKSRDETYFLAALTTAAVLLFTGLMLWLTQRLEASRSLALAASKTKSEFLATMSHELRTPLNGILGYSELLEDDLKGTEQGSFARAIHDSGAHLLDLVNDVLDIGRIEAGGATVSMEPQNIRELVDSAIAGHIGSASNKGLALDHSVDADVPVQLRCDRQKVLRILNNLLHNAIKFTETGAVFLYVRRIGKTIAFAVRDTGPGIPREVRDSLFKKFVQANSTKARSHEGTGLGLALSREMVKLMGGTIDFTSEVGVGTIFTFVIPIVVQEARSAADTVAA